VNVTISGNRALHGAGLFNSGSATLTNVTISANAASYDGGGLFNFGSAVLTNVTISGNSAGETGGGISNQSGGSVRLKNTIVANSPAGGNCSGPITSAGHNLDSGNSCGFNLAQGDLINSDPKLAPLGDNGGPTKTHALSVGSPAVDAGDSSDCPSTDQRGAGFTRPRDGDGNGSSVCDVGAFEIQVAAPAYRFSGFFPPVDNAPAVNTVGAGATIPVRFSLGGDRRLDIFAPEYPKSRLIACDPGVPTDPIEETAQVGQAGLRYSAATDEYTYFWETQRAWKGTCRQLNLKTKDGVDHLANFRFN
jgi:hypothetical protein